VRIRRALSLAGFAVLGAAVVVLPAAASSETAPPAPAVAAEDVGEYTHRWQPPEVAAAPGGTVEFSNATGVPHGIHWVSGPGTPECGAGVPVGTTPAASSPKWSGSCTFAAAGTYRYYCTVHGAAMAGTVTVGTPGTPTTTPTGTGTGTTTGTSVPTGTAPGPGPGAPGATAPAASSALSALRLGSAQHGKVVHGSVTIASSAAGGTLTLVLQARLGGHRVQVGRLTRTYIAAGRQSFSIALSARARRALQAKSHLALLAKVSLTPPGGSTVTQSRTLALHR
jgi:plastocyanin